MIEKSLGEESVAVEGGEAVVSLSLDCVVVAPRRFLLSVDVDIGEVDRLDCDETSVANSSSLVVFPTN